MANKMVQESHYVDRVVNVSRANATDFFASDITPTAGLRPEEIEKHTLMIHVAGVAAKVRIVYVIDGQTVNMTLNDDTALGIDSVHIFDILIPRDCTGYNVQHMDASARNVTCIIAKSKTAMVG